MFDAGIEPAPKNLQDLFQNSTSQKFKRDLAPPSASVFFGRLAPRAPWRLGQTWQQHITGIEINVLTASRHSAWARAGLPQGLCWFRSICDVCLLWHLQPFEPGSVCCRGYCVMLHSDVTSKALSLAFFLLSFSVKMIGRHCMWWATRLIEA